MKVHTLTMLALLPFVGAAEGVSLVHGNWRVRFGETGATLRLENAARRISVEGQLSFVTISSETSQDVKAVLQF